MFLHKLRSHPSLGILGHGQALIICTRWVARTEYWSRMVSVRVIKGLPNLLIHLSIDRKVWHLLCYDIFVYSICDSNLCPLGYHMCISIKMELYYSCTLCFCIALSHNFLLCYLREDLFYDVLIILVSLMKTNDLQVPISMYITIKEKEDKGDVTPHFRWRTGWHHY